jgi:predicted transcriptional regulator
MNDGIVKPAKFATQIDAAVLRRLRRFAREQDRSISRIVSEAVAAYLDRAEVRPAFRRAMDEVLDDNAELLERLAK